ncbi:MAG: hypothetical protein KIT75_03465 [Planctomycetota bacterium]|nr:hypothetical protein [Planctomycetota bacterium]
MSDGANNAGDSKLGNLDPAAMASPDPQATFLDGANPFAQDDGPTMQTEAAPALPPALRSIANQLPPQISAKLKACDVSTALVSLSSAGGAWTEPVRLSLLLFRDFAAACVRRLGVGGEIWVDVKEPGKPDWQFAFEAPATAAGVDASSDRLARLEKLVAQRLDEISLEASLGGGGRKRDDLRETLTLLKEMGIVGQQQNNGAAAFAEMAKAWAELQRVGAESQRGALNQLLESKALAEKMGMGKPPERTAAQELKEVLEIGPVKTVVDAATQAAVRKVLQGGSQASTPAEPSAVDANANPFADLGAA